MTDLPVALSSQLVDKYFQMPGVYSLFSSTDSIILGDDMDKIFHNIVDSKIFCILISNESCAPIQCPVSNFFLSKRGGRTFLYFDAFFAQ